MTMTPTEIEAHFNEIVSWVFVAHLAINEATFPEYCEAFDGFGENLIYGGAVDMSWADCTDTGTLFGAEVRSTRGYCEDVCVKLVKAVRSIPGTTYTSTFFD